VTVKVGINSDKAREINKLIKEKGPKGVSSHPIGTPRSFWNYLSIWIYDTYMDIFDP
jgi:hypothetical protein